MPKFISCEASLSWGVLHAFRNRYRLPIYVFVDELDRCRPNYAVELLECIKHLFGINGIYFIVATDSRQLTHSIKALYGNSFDATRYLKRFFDQEYSFLPPDNKSFAIHLIQKNYLPKEAFFMPLQDVDIQNETFFALCSSYFDLSLRDQEQVCASLAALYFSYGEREIHLGYALFLIILKHRFGEYFDKYLRAANNEKLSLAKEIYLKEPVNRQVIFKTTIWNENHGSPENLTIEKIFSSYIRFSELTIDEIRELKPNDEFSRGVITKLWREHHNQTSNAIGYLGHDLDTYPAMIKRVGQISSINY